MKAMRKTTVYALVVGLVMLLSSQVIFAQTTLSHLSASWNGEPWHQWIRESAAKFNQLYPDIQVELVLADDPAEKFMVTTAGGAPIDVVELDLSMLWEYHLLDLRPLIEKDPDFSWDLYFSSAHRGSEGQIYGIPTILYMTPTYYNKNLFDQAGLATPHELGDGWTWETVLDYAAKLTQDFDGDGRTDQYGTDRIWSRWDIQVAQAGGQPYNSYVYPDRANFSSEEVREGLRYIQTFMQRGYDHEFLADGWTDYFFWLGRSGMSFVDGPGILAGPYLQAAGFEFDIAPQPKGPDNNGGLVIVSESFKINKNSPHTEEAYLWIRFLTSEESLIRLMELTGNIPAMPGLKQEYYESAKDYLPPHWEAFYDVVTNPASFSSIIHMDPVQVAAIENDVLFKIWSGEMDVNPATEELDRRLNALFRELTQD